MADKRLRVLAITYCFTPILLPATMRLLKWFKGLDELGCEVTALAIEPDSFNGPKDEKLNDLVPGNVKALRVWSPENSLLYRALRKQSGIFYKLFEPRKMEWYRPALKALKGVDSGSFDVIFSCSQPHSCHLLGSWLKRKTGKRWVAYFSDPWTDNPYAEYRSKKIFEYNLRLEKETVEGADFVFFTSEETLNLVLKKYPKETRKKCGVLPHCFVPEWYAQGSKGEKRNGKLRLLQTGNFYGARTPMPILNAVARLMKETDLKERVEVLSYGNMEQRYKDFIRANRMDGVVKVNKTIPYLESLSFMGNSDYLLLIDAPVKKAEESIFLPSKLVDYLGSGRPVFGITPLKGTSAKVLKETGNIVCDVGDDEAVYMTLKGMLEGTIKTGTDSAAIGMYHYDRVAKKLKDAFDGRRA